MILFQVFLICSGFYLLLNTSEKAELKPNFIFNFCRKNRKTAQVLGAVLLVTGMVLFSIHQGIASGTLTFFILLFTISSLAILLNPIKLKN